MSNVHHTMVLELAEGHRCVITQGDDGEYRAGPWTHSEDADAMSTADHKHRVHQHRAQQRQQWLDSLRRRAHHGKY